MQISDNYLIPCLREYLQYDERYITCLSWKRKKANCTHVGSIAGGVHKSSGYCFVRFRGKLLAAHRIVFALHHGYFPKEVDHIDLNRSNNKISNLRAATTSQNECNKGLQRNNSSGVKGVNWDKSSGMWKARVAVNGLTKYVGRFHDIKEAEQAIIATRNVLHGEFSRNTA